MYRYNLCKFKLRKHAKGSTPKSAINPQCVGSEDVRLWCTLVISSKTHCARQKIDDGTQLWAKSQILAAEKLKSEKD